MYRTYYGCKCTQPNREIQNIRLQSLDLTNSRPKPQLCTNYSTRVDYFLWKQYLRYLRTTMRLESGISFQFYVHLYVITLSTGVIFFIHT